MVVSCNNLRTSRYLLKIAYVGTKYKGVQRQTRRIEGGLDDEDGTIQCALEKALNKALRPVYGARLALSSRTDAGVHALQNTANLDLTHPFPNTLYKPSFIIDATNCALVDADHEITLLEARLVPSHFHSRINAKWRSYIYRVAMTPQQYLCRSINQHSQYQLLRRQLPISQVNRCHIVGLVDTQLVRKSMERLKGEHDFASFSTKDSSDKEKCTVKCVDQFELRKSLTSTIHEAGASDYDSQIEYFEFHIKSKSFLYNQVRRMVGAVLDVGLGRITLDQLDQMLKRPPYRPPGLSNMVPACGLYLVEVGYDQHDMILGDNFMEYAPKAYYGKIFDDY